MTQQQRNDYIAEKILGAKKKFFITPGCMLRERIPSPI